VSAPRWVLFDLNGTLLDPRPSGRALPVVDGTAVVLASLHDAVVQGMVDTLSGEYRPFLGYIHGALQRQAQLAGAELDRESVEAVVRQMARMPPFADSSDAIALLRELGLHVGVLTNSAESLALDALEAAGLGAQVARVIASDGVRAYKPATSVYRTAVEQLGVRPTEIVMVSAHWWDVTGAKRAGLQTAWVSAKERVLMPGAPTPDVQGKSLLAVAHAIAGAIRGLVRPAGE
jgi:2-haloacid dehalogenase